MKLKGEQAITNTNPELQKMKIEWEQDIMYLGLKQQKIKLKCRSVLYLPDARQTSWEKSSSGSLVMLKGC